MFAMQRRCSKKVNAPAEGYNRDVTGWLTFAFCFESEATEYRAVLILEVALDGFTETPANAYRLAGIVAS